MNHILKKLFRKKHYLKWQIKRWIRIRIVKNFKVIFNLKYNFEVGDKIYLRDCSEEWVGLEGTITKLSAFGDFYVKFTSGNEYHSIGETWSIPKHILKKINED